MKEYVKPEIEVIDFVSEVITDGSTGNTSGDGVTTVDVL